MIDFANLVFVVGVSMDQTVLIWGAVLVVIGTISWYRSGKKTAADLITRQDAITAKGCIRMALEVLGSALEPDSVQTPADAIEVGKNAISKHGMSCAIVANVLAQGLLGSYVAKHQLSSERTQALMHHCCDLLADGYGLSVAELWDRSAELIKVRGPLGFLMQQGLQEGVALPNKVKGRSVLAGFVLEAVEQARE